MFYILYILKDALTGFVDKRPLLSNKLRVVLACYNCVRSTYEPQFAYISIGVPYRESYS